MKILRLTIKRKYFEEIKKGEKKEEFRIIKQYWINSLFDKNYDIIEFKNGYKKDSPIIKTEYNGFKEKKITHEFFGNKELLVFAIQIGKILNE